MSFPAESSGQTSDEAPHPLATAPKVRSSHLSPSWRVKQWVLSEDTWSNMDSGLTPPFVSRAPLDKPHNHSGLVFPPVTWGNSSPFRTGCVKHAVGRLHRVGHLINEAELRMCGPPNIPCHALSALDSRSFL